ncbi:hypothetical protein pb186bvf_004492 [Paramecium bursaria]
MRYTIIRYERMISQIIKNYQSQENIVIQMNQNNNYENQQSLSLLIPNHVSSFKKFLFQLEIPIHYIINIKILELNYCNEQRKKKLQSQFYQKE